MPETTPLLGRRIVVWGVTGSGKTTLARRLGEALGLPVVQLDAIRHRNGWDSTDWPEFRTELSETLDGYTDGWVLEGSYSAIRDVYVSRLDTLIWLHLPWRVSFWRLLKRTIARAWDRTPLYNPDGPTESWRNLLFLRRDSILWWSIFTHRDATRRRAERIATLPPHVKRYELRSADEVDRLLEHVKRPVGAGGE